MNLAIHKQGLRYFALVVLIGFVSSLFVSFGSKVLCYSNDHTAVESIHKTQWLAAQTESSFSATSEDCSNKGVLERHYKRCVDIPLVEADSLLNSGVPSYKILFSVFLDLHIQFFRSFIARIQASPLSDKHLLTFFPSELTFPHSNQNILTIVLRI